jgi:hypothetical protein
MSWAAKRVTTRKEDIAYCLLGIFNVNMPLIYGEGERAFIRLQEEIMKEKNDLSLLAWQSASTTRLRGALASSPREFTNCGSLISTVRTPSERNIRHTGIQFHENPEFAMTNKGLRIESPISVINVGRALSVFLPLNITNPEEPRVIYGISLISVGNAVFYRDKPHSLETMGTEPHLPGSVIIGPDVLEKIEHGTGNKWVQRPIYIPKNANIPNEQYS